MSNKKGGYKIVSLKNLDLLTESLVIVGVFLALSDSHGKTIMLDDIVIDGEEKKSAYVHAEKIDDKIVIKNLYGYDLSIDDEDSVVVTENADGIELPKPTAEDNGSIVGVSIQGKYVLKPSVEEQVAQAPSGTIVNVLGLDSEGGLVKGTISGGTKLYLHRYVSDYKELRIISTSSEAINPQHFSLNKSNHIVYATYTPNNSAENANYFRIIYGNRPAGTFYLYYLDISDSLTLAHVEPPTVTETEIVQL